MNFSNYLTTVIMLMNFSIHRDMVVIDIHEKNDSKRKITQGLKNLACMLVKITIKKRRMKCKKRTEDYKM